MRRLVFLVLLLGLGACAPEKKSVARRLELFDGKTLNGWSAIEFEIGGGAEALVGEDGSLQLGMGEPMAGLVFDSPEVSMPSGDYEIELEAKIVDGNDFFCGLTFPIPSQKTCCTLIVGGWGGTVVGISNVNGNDASLNTTRYDRPFKPRQWYHIRARVTEKYLDVWIDGEVVIELDISERRIDMLPGQIEECKPIGIATWKTAAAYRNIRLREL